MAYIKADAPITQERALADLKAILYVAQHSRSIMAEHGWTDDIAQRVLADLEPWLWDQDRVFVLPLAKMIQRAETAGYVQPIDYYNMLIIAHKTPSVIVGVMLMADRELPEPSLDVMKALMVTTPLLAESSASTETDQPRQTN